MYLSDLCILQVAHQGFGCPSMVMMFLLTKIYCRRATVLLHGISTGAGLIDPSVISIQPIFFKLLFGTEIPTGEPICV